MTYYKNPITRFLLRKNIFRRIRFRLNKYQRLITKDAFSDIKFLEQNRSVKTIFDVGANIGFVTYQFQKRFPNSDIYAFEPNPYVFKKLQASYLQDKKIHPFQMGIGDVLGDLEFNINENTGTSSFLEPGDYHRTHQAKHLKEQRQVSTITIDEFCEEKGIKHIDILKLDIEGYEMRALQGADELLSNQAIDIIYTEVNVIPSYEKQPLFHQLTNYLQEKQYFIYNIYSFVGQETPIRQAVIGNVTYISSEFRKSLEKNFGKNNCGW